MRVACVLVTHLPSKVELQRQPHLRDVPAVIVHRSLVVDTLPRSMASTGMTAEQALSLQPGAVALPADDPAYRRVFQQVLSSLQGVSDRVEEAELGVAYVQLDGLAEMYGGEARLTSTLLHSLPDYLRPRVGLADGKFPALVAARTATSLGANRAPPDAAAFLGPHSVDLLPVPDAVKAALHRFGLHSLGDLAAWKVEPLVDQFGAAGRLAWELSRGVDTRPVLPLQNQEAVAERLTLPTASVSLELLLTAVDRLARRAFDRPDVRGRYAGWAALACVLVQRPLWEKTVHFRRGVGRWEEASTILRGQLATDYPPAPMEEVGLTLGGLSGGSAVQMWLLPDLQKDRHRRLVEVERQLQVKTNGRHSLHRVLRVAPRHPAPEMRALLAPIDPSAGDEMRPLAVPVPVPVEEGLGGVPSIVRIGRTWRRVARVEDSWCFDLWWTHEPMTRSYYRVSQDDGAQTTLFRDERTGRWYQQRS